MGGYKSILDRINKIINGNAGVIRMIKMLLIFILLVHLFACFYFLIAKLQDFGIDTWVYHLNIIDLSPKE